MSQKHTEKRKKLTLNNTTLATDLVTDLEDGISEQTSGGDLSISTLKNLAAQLNWTWIGGWPGF